MRFLRAFAIGVITAVVGMFLAIFASDYLRASLYANNRDTRYASIDLKSIRMQDSYVIVSGTAPLMSHSANRSLLASIGNEPDASQFIDLKTLPAAPRNENETWSDWSLATQRVDLTPVPELERIAVRYRVRSVDN